LGLGMTWHLYEPNDEVKYSTIWKNMDHHLMLIVQRYATFFIYYRTYKLIGIFMLDLHEIYDRRQQINKIYYVQTNKKLTNKTLQKMRTNKENLHRDDIFMDNGWIFPEILDRFCHNYNRILQFP
ncbi:hypothetical protein ACJX0J_030481, partial [Zea mays]